MNNYTNLEENSNKEDSFCHLHVHSEYSTLDSSAKIKDLIKKAKEYNMNYLAITDHGNMYGVLKFYKECKKNNIKPIIGCEFYITQDVETKNSNRDNHHIILLAKNFIGYQNLLKLTSIASKNFYYKPRIDNKILKEHKEGLICLSACIAGEIPSYILNDKMPLAINKIEEYKELFKDDFYLEIQYHYMPEEKKVNEIFIELSKKYNIKLVATNDVHYVEKIDAEAQDILLCIQTNKLISDSSRLKFPNGEFYFKSYKEMFSIFKNTENCLKNTIEIANKCNIEIPLNLKLSPVFPNIPKGYTEKTYLKKLCLDNIDKKYTKITKEIEDRLNYEYEIISKMNYCGYFLIVWDFINYAKKNNIIIGPGRGSAAGSIIAYILNITNLDPLKYGLLFERFLNPERVSMPDIDTDIDDQNRDLVIKYMMETYGYEKSAQIVTFGKQMARGAIRDIGRVLGISLDKVDKIAKLIPKEQNISITNALQENKELLTLYERDYETKKIIDLSLKIEGLPRQTGTHAAGVVISQEDLDTILPVYEMSDGFHTQFDKEEVEEIGLLKMDLLGLKTLTIIDMAIKNIKKSRNINIDIDKIPMNDKKTFEMLTQGDTLGVFQLESNGMVDLIKKIAPSCFEDLIPLVALYRPGPLGSGMVDDFIKGKHGEKVEEYLHPLLEPILKETFGVILYQEQVMQSVQILAGFSLGKADIMRRAMGKKKAKLLEEQKNSFIEGCIKNKILLEKANEIFDIIAHFADYGFNKSHSAAYALVAYQTAFLKANYPTEYFASLLSNVLDNEDKIIKYLNNAKSKEIKILEPSIVSSQYYFTVDNNNKNTIRFGLGAIKGLGLTTIENILQTEKIFENIIDFLLKINIDKTNLENLIKIGALDSFIHNRKETILNIENIISETKKYKDILKKVEKLETNTINLFESENNNYLKKPPVLDNLLINKSENDYSITEKLNIEKSLTGFYISANPLDFCKDTIKYCANIEDIFKNQNEYINKNIYLCGTIKEFKEVHTKKGDKMCIFYLEIYEYTIKCIVFPQNYEKINRDIFSKIIYLVKGYIKENNSLPEFIVDKIQSKNL